jgi:copper chaperone CopZ
MGALASAVLASACCWLPLILIAVGVSGGALSATFEAWRPVLLSVTFVLLGVAFYFTYRKPKVLAAASAGTAASGESCCSVPEQGAAETCCSPENTKGATLKKVNKVLLWVVTVFVLAFAFFPNYVGYLLGGGNALAARSHLDKIVVKIDGMTCEACAANIENALSKVPGVAAAEVSYERREAVVGVPRGSQPPREAILAALAGAGDYQGTFADQARWTLAIEGMTCEGCATGLQAALAKVPGVTSASVSYEEGRASVTAGSSVSEETLRKTVSEAGYTVTTATRDGQATRSGDQR